MNKRQKKKMEKKSTAPQMSSALLWDQLKHLGGKKQDTYVVIKEAAMWGGRKIREGEFLRVREDFPDSEPYTWLQTKEVRAEQVEHDWNIYAGSGYPFNANEFEIIWKDGAPV